MPVIKHEQLKQYKRPVKVTNRLRIALSHEFVELYRGDKDLRVGKILCRDYGCEIVHLGTDIASPADSRVFKSKSYPIEQIGKLPDDYFLLLQKTRLIFHRRGNISLGGFFRWTPGIISELLRWKPDLIFENPYLTLTPRSYMTFIASKLLKIPLVYIDCGDILPGVTLKHKLVLPVEKQAARKTAAVITYNRSGKQRFIKKYEIPAEKICILPKPVDTLRFNPYIDCREFRQQYKLEGKFVVAYFGRLCSNKGAKHLLHAANILRQRQADKEIVFLFVGGNLEADQAQEFKTELQKLNLDRVTLTGMVPNEHMPQAYAAVDVAVFPDVTNLPGFSTVLAESMASGLPIIIGIKGWENAVPITDGNNGMIIEPSNSQQLADMIEILKGNHQLRKKLADNVLTYAQNMMDYNKIVKRYFDIFCRLTGKNPKLNFQEHDKRIKRKSKKTAV